jgi:hypothetical protein
MELTDPYATAKGNLRDTIKWLATTFGAFTAVVVAGAPFSGFGALTPWTVRFDVAIVSLAFSAICLAGVWSILIHLLKPDLVYTSYLLAGFQLDDTITGKEIRKVREEIRAHATDLFPPDITNFDGLVKLTQAHWDVASDQNKTTSEQAAARQSCADYTSLVHRILDYAAFVRLHHRTFDAMSSIKILGGLAMLSLIVFAWASNPAKSEPRQSVTVLQPYSKVGPFDPMPTILFAQDSSAISAFEQRKITIARQFLLKQPAAGVLLKAHTDTTGSDEHNRDLANRRGIAIREALTKPGGIAPSRVFIAELANTDLPKITPKQTAAPENRSVELLAVQLPDVSKPEQN